MTMNRDQRRAYARENGVPMPPPEPQEVDVRFAPVPVSTAVQGVDTPEGGMVVLQITSPVGVQAFFLSADHARDLAGHLHQYATAAASGLQIVGNLGDPVG